MLVSRASKGDRDALSELCESIAKGVQYRVMYGINNPTDAEDVAQEVLLCVCKSIHQLSSPEAFRVWLGKIIIGETNRFMQRSYKHKDVLDINDYLELVVEDRGTFLPSEYAENAEIRKAVIDAISELPPRQRQAVIFHYYDGLSVKDIAEAMELSQPSVSTHLARARETVKSELKKRDHSVSFTKEHTMSLGLFLFDVFNDEAAAFVLPNAEWLQGALAQCSEYIAAGTVAVATVAGTATATATTAAATTTTPAATAAAEVTTVVASTVAGWKICAAAAVAVCSVGVGALLINTQSTSPTQTYVTQEAGSSSIAFPVETGQIQVEGTIAFTGGIDKGETTVHINPTHAEPIVDSTGGEVTALEWWITEEKGIYTLYSSNNSDNLDTALMTLQTNGSKGEYRLFYRLTCESGAIHRLCSNFYIE